MIYKLNHQWIFKKRNCKVLLPNACLNKIICKILKSWPKETGGTLVGNYSKDLLSARVQSVIGVKKGAIRTRTSFYRPSDTVDNQLKKIYKKSNGKIHYLGEWHSHPEYSPNLSEIDKNSIIDIAKSEKVKVDTPILLILGGNFLEQNISYECVLAEKSGALIKGIYTGLYVFNSKP